MKIFLRSMACFMLVVVLFSFTMWRREAVADLSVITDFAMGLVEKLTPMPVGSSSPATPESSTGRPTDAGAEFPQYALSGEIDPDLEELVYEAMLAREANIDVSDFHLSEESLQDLVSKIRFLHPDLFFVDKTFSFTKDDMTQAIIMLRPRYIYADGEHQQKMEAYNAYVKAIVDQIPDGNDFDKLLYIHDYFVREYSYDYSYTIRDAYTFFEQKTGVCQAYMLALIAVAGEVGIESVPVTSNRMNHAWNLVKLDGSWYHIDITWDDTGAYPAQTSYAYFLQSDAGIIDIDRDRIDESAAEPDWHCDWETTQKATETRYDNAVWHRSGTPMVKKGQTYYCTAYTGVDDAQRSSGAIFAGESPAVMGQILTINSLWRLNGGNQYYLDCYAGLAVYGDLLIYNTHNSLRAYNTVTGEDRQLDILADIGTDCIFGLVGVTGGGKVTCVVSSVATGGSYYLLEYTIV